MKRPRESGRRPPSPARGNPVSKDLRNPIAKAAMDRLLPAAWTPSSVQTASPFYCSGFPTARRSQRYRSMLRMSSQLERQRIAATQDPFMGSPRTAFSV